eukprot:1246826-Alexandrium_andersonii.AAC.1
MALRPTHNSTGQPSPLSMARNIAASFWNANSLSQRSSDGPQPSNPAAVAGDFRATRRRNCP